MENSDRNWRLGLMLALAPAMLWGCLTILLKMIDGMDALTITWYRFLVAAIFFWLVLRRRGNIPTIDKFRGENLKLILIAVFGLCGNFVVFLTGLRQQAITPDAAQVLIQLGPILTLLGSVVLFKESFRPAQWIGFFTFFAGLLLFFHHRLEGLVTQWNNFSFGMLLIVFAAAIWAAYALAQRQLLRRQWTPTQILFVIYLCGTLATLPFARPAQILNLTFLHWCLLIFASFNSIAAYAFFAKAQLHWESSKISAVLTLTPLLTLGYSQLVPFVFPGYQHAEPIDQLSVPGAGLVVIGSMRAVLIRQRTPQKAITNDRLELATPQPRPSHAD